MMLQHILLAIVVAAVEGQHGYIPNIIPGTVVCDGRYILLQSLGKGSFGEAWLAESRNGPYREVVLKRFFVENGLSVRQSGLREEYFGKWANGTDHVSRYIGSCESKLDQPSQPWLIFENEGKSLTNHFYDKPSQPDQPRRPSDYWMGMKRDAKGGQMIKQVMYQLLHASAMAHAANITHRDIKLENIFMSTAWPPVVRLGDWGSALEVPPNDYMRWLYYPDEPNENQETSRHMPPEVLFCDEILQQGNSSVADHWREATYDLWSLGVVFFEIVTGEEGIFHLDKRKRGAQNKLEHSLNRRKFPTKCLSKTMELQAILDLCGLDCFKNTRADSCTKRDRHQRSADLKELLEQYDVSQNSTGLEEDGRDLMMSLLEFDPRKRITAQDALNHKYFNDKAWFPEPQWTTTTTTRSVTTTTTCRNIAGEYASGGGTGYKVSFSVNSGFLSGDGCYFSGMDNGQMMPWKKVQTLYGSVDGNSVTVIQDNGYHYTGTVNEDGSLTLSSGVTWYKLANIAASKAYSDCADIAGEYTSADGTGYKVSLSVNAGFLSGDGCSFSGMDNGHVMHWKRVQTLYGTVDGNSVTVTQDNGLYYTGTINEDGSLSLSSGSTWYKQSNVIILT